MRFRSFGIFLNWKSSLSWNCHHTLTQWEIADTGTMTTDSMLISIRYWCDIFSDTDVGHIEILLQNSKYAVGAVTHHRNWHWLGGRSTRRLLIIIKLKVLDVDSCLRPTDTTNIEGKPWASGTRGPAAPWGAAWCPAACWVVSVTATGRPGGTRSGEPCVGGGTCHHVLQGRVWCGGWILEGEYKMDGGAEESGLHLSLAGYVGMGM